MTLFDRFDRFRRGADVRRYHTHRCVRVQTVGAHSWGVAVLCDLIWTEAYQCAAPSTLLLAALHHDLAEYDAGDSPAWVKRRCPDLKAALDGLERESEVRLGLVTVRALPLYEAVLKLADELEFLWYCLEERRAGNSEVDVMFARGVLGAQRRLAERLNVSGVGDFATLVEIGTPLVGRIAWEFAALVGPGIWGGLVDRVRDGDDYFSRVERGQLDEEGEA